MSVGDGALRVTAGAGEANRLAIAQRGGELVVSDAGAPGELAAGPGCDLDTADELVSCAAAGVGRAGVTVGDRDDVVSYALALPAWILGGAGFDRLSGGDAADALDGGDDADTLQGGLGGDTLAGGAGNDALIGLAGTDALRGDAGDDSLAGGDGDDRLDGGDGHDALSGELGNDLLAAGPGDDHASGGLGDDLLATGAGNDYAGGGEGADGLDGAGGNDTLGGDAGDDTLLGGSEDDTLGGGVGNDRLAGDDGTDALFGEDGADRLAGGAGNDYVLGGTGGDRVLGDRGIDRVDGGSGNDRLAVRDRKADSALCGPGRDSVRAEVLDALDFTCERVDYGRAGSVGRLRAITGGGRFVTIPGQAPARVDRRILKDVLYLIRRYKVRVGDGYALRGHKRHGEHPLGLAVDLYPGAGGSWRKVAKLAKWAEPRQNRPRWPFRWVGFNGDPRHGDPKHCRPSRGCPPHLHLSWAHSPGRPGRPVRRVWVWQVRGG